MNLQISAAVGKGKNWNNIPLVFMHPDQFYTSLPAVVESQGKYYVKVRIDTKYLPKGTNCFTIEVGERDEEYDSVSS